MSTIHSNYFNYNSSMFSGFTVNSSNSSTSSSTSLLTDYMSIRSGSYKKLLKAYYAKLEKDGAATGSTTSKGETSSETKLLSTAKSDAAELKSAADKLTSKSLYQKVTRITKDEKTGVETTTTDYDRDAIAGAVKAFTESYNKTLDSAAEQDNVLILRKAAYMTKSTAVNKRSLAELGITIGEDNKLSVDETKLKAADISTIRSMFEGSGSYMGGVSKRAGDIATMAEQLIKNATKNNASTYTSSGKYSSLSTGDLYDATF